MKEAFWRLKQNFEAFFVWEWSLVILNFEFLKCFILFYCITLCLALIYRSWKLNFTMHYMPHKYICWILVNFFLLGHMYSSNIFFENIFMCVYSLSIWLMHVSSVYLIIRSLMPNKMDAYVKLCIGFLVPLCYMYSSDLFHHICVIYSNYMTICCFGRYLF